MSSLRDATNVMLLDLLQFLVNSSFKIIRVLRHATFCTIITFIFRNLKLCYRSTYWLITIESLHSTGALSIYVPVSLLDFVFVHNRKPMTSHEVAISVSIIASIRFFSIYHLMLVVSTCSWHLIVIKWRQPFLL